MEPITLNLTIDLDQYLVVHRRGVGPDGEGGERITVEQILIEEMAHQFLDRVWAHGYGDTAERRIKEALVTTVRAELSQMVDEAVTSQNISALIEATSVEILANASKSVSTRTGDKAPPSVLEQLVSKAVSAELGKDASKAVEDVKAAARAEATTIAAEALIAATAKLALPR